MKSDSSRGERTINSLYFKDLQKKLLPVAIDRIDPDDQTYRYRSAGRIESLIESIGRIGLVHPVILQAKGADAYRIVCGFKRLAALASLGWPTCQALVIEETEPRVELFCMAVLENQSNTPLNAIELSTVLHKLQSEFMLDETEIVQSYLPMLGYGRNPRVLQLYSGLHALPPVWQEALTAGHVSLDIGKEMLRRSEQDQVEIWRLFEALRLGKNRQREILALLSDVSRMEDATVAQLIGSPSVQDILNAHLTPSQKSERIKQWLWAKRYPRYSAVQARFAEILHAARLPRHVQIQAPPYFEGDSYSVTFAFSGESDYSETIGALKKLLDDNVVKDLLQLP